MYAPTLRLTLAGLALGGLAASAPAQAPAAPPRVITWPGGSLVLDGPGVVLRGRAADGKSLNVVTGSGNGIGNRVVVTGAPGSVTVLRNARNGIGNRVVVGGDDLAIDVDALLADLLPPAAKAPAVKPVAPPSHKGKANPFWTRKGFSDAHDCNLYWDPTNRLWFRYHADDDTYRPVATQPPAPPEEQPPMPPEQLPPMPPEQLPPDTAGATVPPRPGE